MTRFADGHADTLGAIANGKVPVVTPDGLRRNGVALQVMALFTSGKDGARDALDKVNAQLRAFGLWLPDSGCVQLTRVPDVWQDAPGVMLSLENCECLCGDAAALDALYAKGVRVASLTWNGENTLAGGVGSGGGLKPFGRDVIRRMNALGVALDLSHLNDKSFDDAMSASAVPPLCTHSCARDLCPHLRNLTREQIKRLCASGGFIGVNFYPRFLVPEGPATSADIARHIAYIAEVAGPDRVGLGSDFDGIEVYPSDVSGPDGLAHVVRALERVGFTTDEIEGVAHTNFARYLRGVVG